MSSEAAVRGETDKEENWRQIREKVLERDGYACRFCGTTNEEHLEETDRGLDVHHIIPQKDGGADTMRNLAALCRSCHRTMESLHGQAMGELEADAELAERVADVVDRMSRDANEDWFELLGGPFTPSFQRADQGQGIFMTGANEFSSRERAAFYAGRVEALWNAGSELRVALEREEYADELQSRHFSRPSWSQHITRCDCGERVDTVAHRACPECGTEVKTDE